MKKNKLIPFHKPSIPKKAVSLIAKSIQSGWITTGTRVKEFEKRVSAASGGLYPVAVSSCTAALHTAYTLLGFKKGDEVLVPSFTFCSTINMIVAAGGTPVFVDIDPKTYCIDPKDIRQKITLKTKAIVVVHYAGMPADMTAIESIARKHNLSIVEDAAHAFGSTYKGHQIGSSKKNLTCFSFYATKNITTAEGGMLMCRNADEENRARLFSNHGISRDAWKRYLPGGSYRYEVFSPGYKYNMSDIHASIGIAELKILPALKRKRLAIVAKYKKLLTGNPHINLPHDPPHKDSVHAWHLFTIEILPTSLVTRDELSEFLSLRGIGTSVHYIPNHLQPYYRKKYPSLVLPNTETVAERILSIPLYENLSMSDVEFICACINEATGYGKQK